MVLIKLVGDFKHFPCQTVADVSFVFDSMESYGSENVKKGSSCAVN